MRLGRRADALRARSRRPSSDRARGGLGRDRRAGGRSGARAGYRPGRARRLRDRRDGADARLLLLRDLRRPQPAGHVRPHECGRDPAARRARAAYRGAPAGPRHRRRGLRPVPQRLARARPSVQPVSELRRRLGRDRRGLVARPAPRVTGRAQPGRWCMSIATAVPSRGAEQPLAAELADRPAVVEPHACPQTWTAFAADVLQGLTTATKTLPQWFYDARWSELFGALHADAARADLRLRAWHTDADGWYGVSLLAPGGEVR